MENNLIYGVHDRPPFGKTLIFAFQQVLAILAATIAVPTAVGHGMSQSAALFGAGVGTIVYLLFTKFRSPVFLGSSFAFLGSMTAAFAGGVSMSVGYLGLIIGAILAGLVYVFLALIVKKCGSNWVNKLMPPVVIGPTVAIIGLSLAGNAVGDLSNGGIRIDGVSICSPYLAVLCGIVTLGATIACSVYGKKMLKMIPFIIGILAGYALAAIFTGFGYLCNVDALKIVNFELFNSIKWYPDFTFLTAIKGFNEFTWSNLGTIAVAYVPVAFVVFAEHIADHKNLSTVIGSDLLKDPGLDKTLLGDGVGSMAGAIFGGCPNTTYGESVGCVAISRNASVSTIFVTAIMCMLASFVGPFVTFLATIPSCVMGGVCIALYGFIAVSGLKMIQKADLEDNKNLFVVSVILIAGVGGMTLSFGQITITEVACALILGILARVLVSFKKDNKVEEKVISEDTVTVEVKTEEDK